MLVNDEFNFQVFLGIEYSALTRLEMITLLCVGDLKHSELIEAMPERYGTGQSRDFEAILGQVCFNICPILGFSHVP